MSTHFASVVKSVSIPCIGRVDPLSKFLLLSYGQPMLLFGSWLFLYIVMRVYHKHKKLPFPKKPFYLSLWNLVLLCFKALNYTGFHLLNCRKVGPYMVLEGNDNIMCHGAGFKLAQIVSVTISVAVSVVLPVYSIYLHSKLIKQSRRLSVQHMVQLGRAFSRNLTAAIRRSGFISTSKVVPVDKQAHSIGGSPTKSAEGHAGKPALFVVPRPGTATGPQTNMIKVKPKTSQLSVGASVPEDCAPPPDRAAVDLCALVTESPSGLNKSSSLPALSSTTTDNTGGQGARDVTIQDVLDRDARP